AVEPVGDHLSRPNGCGVAKQDKKRGLKSILGIVRTAQQSSAHAEHHRSVPAQKGFKGVFIALDDEVLEQLTIGPPRAVVGEHSFAKMFHDLVQPAACQRCSLPGWRLQHCVVHILFPCPRLFHTVFFSGAPICAAKDCATDTQTKSALMPSATSRTPKMPSRSRSLSWAGGGLDPQRRGPGQLAARGCPAPGHELETKSTAENEK